MRRAAPSATRPRGDLLLDGQKLGAFAAFTYDSKDHTFRRSGAIYGKAGRFEVLGYGLWAGSPSARSWSGRLDWRPQAPE